MNTDAQAIEHSNRFRRYGNVAPRIVAQAYGGDLARVAADTDEQCLANADAYLRGQGIDPEEWWTPEDKAARP